ncbi:MAG TPA: chemotaxis-specific protein-glutamate methyltransferase CheB [Gemmatimonadaceae bacterium]|jgi:two-component system chemotaxis response regulator CheB|nr:chemotaxis-specific protein-glutamate methyltransferase CheB [Gemmatimonadaceae bacterium]
MPPSQRRIRVLVVEDSPTARQLIVALLRDDGDFEVVGEAANGVDAVAAAVQLAPDLITMDVHMPVMDGLDATREIMRRAPTPIVIVSGTFSRDDVEAALTATRAGALMVVPKPDSPTSGDFSLRRDEFLSMAKAMAAVRVVRRWRGARPTSASDRSTNGWPSAPHVAPRLVAIGTSTGGPAALYRILTDLPAEFPLPVVIVQHMAHGFIDGLANWLSSNTGHRVVVGASGEVVLPNVAYIAPDDQHMSVLQDGRIALSKIGPVNGFRPAIDQLFDGCARAFGGSLIAAILTGMGQDGAAGLRTAYRGGAHVIAQDEASSVVFGMARTAIEDGVVSEILPLDAIGHRLAALAARTTNGGAFQ